MGKDNDIPIVVAELVEDDEANIDSNIDLTENPPAYAPGFSAAASAPPPTASMIGSNIESRQPKPTTTYTTTTTTYTISPPAQVVTRIETYLGRNPKGLQCPHCNRQSVTRVRDRSDCVTIVLVIVLLFVFWPLFWLPFCIPGCKSTDHYCSVCNRKIGTTDACE